VFCYGGKGTEEEGTTLEVVSSHRTRSVQLLGGERSLGVGGKSREKKKGWGNLIPNQKISKCLKMDGGTCWEEGDLKIRGGGRNH